MTDNQTSQNLYQCSFDLHRVNSHVQKYTVFITIPLHIYTCVCSHVIIQRRVVYALYIFIHHVPVTISVALDVEILP